METKINIAAILKDKPKGTKLYSYICAGECVLNEVSENAIYVDMYNKERFWRFSVYGTIYAFPNGGVLLYPSYEMRDWRKFSWKKGDVLVNKDESVHIIFEKFEDDAYKNFHGQYYLWEEGGSIVNFEEDEYNMQTSDFNKANKEDAQEYIHKIEKELGGKLNRETLEIEKAQPEFKDGDVVALDTRYIDSDEVIVESFIVRGDYKYGDDLKFYAACSNNKETDVVYNSSIMINKTSARKESLRLSTEEEKLQLFDALAKEGKAWDAEKKQIVDLKPNVDELKPFDKVLVKDNPYGSWEPAIFWKKVDAIDLHLYMVIGGKRYRFCEPYEGNEHFLND